MKKALTATLVLGLSASASAQLLGSDTMFEMINDPVSGILANCPGAAGLTYGGTGSGAGETAMRNDAQEVSPMSRFLNPAAANTCRTAQSGCFLTSLDALSILSNANNTDGLPGTGGVCDTLNYGKTLPSGYVVDDWRTALRLVYGGNATQVINYNACAVDAAPRILAGKDCAGAVRAELINNWGNLFQNNCNDGDCTQLKHAFRRDDVSGSTDVFLEALALPPIASTPFCNGTEIQDLDPVRRTCDGNGRNQFDGEQVCARDGTLGVVLPLVIPQAAQDPYLTTLSGPAVSRDGPGADCVTAWEAAEIAPLCSTSALGGTFQRIANPPGITTCPVGAVVGGTCLWPKKTGSASGQGFSCTVGKNNLPASITGQDARAWNLFPRRENGNPITYVRGTSNRIMSSAYYRLHMTSQLAAGDRPAVVVGTTTRTQGCMFADSTEQIGCLVEASPCSIGYAGNSAASPNAECGSAANRRALTLETPAGGGIVAAPTDTNVRRFLNPTGAGCAAAGDFDERYALSRGLWLCTLDGEASNVTPGTQSAAFQAQQAALAVCMQSRATVDTAVNATGFITLDTTGTLPIIKRACP
jgi:hypothetical protein